MSAVKLRDFFENQSHIVLGADRKAQILSIIKAQTYTSRQNISWSSVRHSWYFKIATTATLAFALIYILYTPVSRPLFDISNNLLVARQANLVQAGYVGEIFATQGDITIMRQGIATTTSQLRGGDIIYLYNTSKANFTLRDGSHGVVEGPAQLTILEHQDSGLVLSVNHARYMEIDKNTHTGSSTNITQETLVIETNTSRITTDKDETVHLALVTAENRQFIQNKGDTVTIQSIVPDTASPVAQQLANSHVAEVTDIVKVYTEVAMIYDELSTQSSSETYQFDQPHVNDVKALLALITTKTQPVSQTLIVYDNRTSTPNVDPSNTSQPNDQIVKPSQTTDETVAQQSDQIQPILMTMRANNIDSSFTGLETEIIVPDITLSSRDKDLVNEVLDQISSDIASGDTDAKSSADKQPTAKSISTRDMLTPNQLSLLKSYHNYSRCITTGHLHQLQKAFDTSESSLTEIVANIMSGFYLTNEFKGYVDHISTLSLCTHTSDNDN